MSAELIRALVQQGRQRLSPEAVTAAQRRVSPLVAAMLPGVGEAMDVRESQAAGQRMADAFRAGRYGEAAGAGAESLAAALAAVVPGLPAMGSTVRLYHGTSEDAAEEILSSKEIRGKAFLTPRKDVAEEYGETALPIDVDPKNLEIDLDMPGQRTLTVDEANAYLGNEDWTIEDYLNEGFSVAVPGGVRL